MGASNPDSYMTYYAFSTILMAVIWLGCGQLEYFQLESSEIV